MNADDVLELYDRWEVRVLAVSVPERGLSLFGVGQAEMRHRLEDRSGGIRKRLVVEALTSGMELEGLVLRSVRCNFRVAIWLPEGESPRVLTMIDR